jgi:hypothetical protein
MTTYFVNAGFFTRESYVQTRQAELRVNPTVAFYPANFNVGDVCELDVIDICTPPFSAIELDLVLQVYLLRREVARLSPIRRCCSKALRLSGHKQVSHTTLSVLVAELQLYGSSRWGRTGRGRGRGVDFYIYPTSLVERKALLDALKDFVV